MFVKNSATQGGAISLYNNHVRINFIYFQGLTLFANNSAVVGGAIICHRKNNAISFTGNTIYSLAIE